MPRKSIFRKNKSKVETPQESKKDKSKLEKENIVVIVDLDENSTPGEKFNKWELKGVPIRIDLGKRELSSKKLSVFRRDLNKKELINEKDLLVYVKKVKKEGEQYASYSRIARTHPTTTLRP